jgi:hypothetical protein
MIKSSLFVLNNHNLAKFPRLCADDEEKEALLVVGKD